MSEDEIREFIRNNLEIKLDCCMQGECVSVELILCDEVIDSDSVDIT